MTPMPSPIGTGISLFSLPKPWGMTSRVTVLSTFTVEKLTAWETNGGKRASMCMAPKTRTMESEKDGSLTLTET